MSPRIAIVGAGPAGIYAADILLTQLPDAKIDLIEKLPAREQAVLKMRFFEELTQTQIAERIGYSQMHVSRLLASALNTLRSQALNDGQAPRPAQLRGERVA